jgi:2-haloacid dehalogenase
MNASNSKIQAVVFDAYGTLFDVHSVVALCEQLFPGKGMQLSQLWRTKQLEYSWLRSLMQRYEDFWLITEAGLQYACAALKLECDAATREKLMNAYLHLTPYPEVPAMLRSLGHLPLAILSNGSPMMLNAVVKNSGLEKHFNEIISVDELRCFKPDPRVYQLVPQKLGVAKQSIAFVSANGWDIAGCSAFGFQPFWVNRGNQPADLLGAAPRAVLTNLEPLCALLIQA